MKKRGERKSNVFESKEGYAIYAPFYDGSLAFLDTFEKNELFTLLGDLSGKKILDSGCGTGRLIHRLMVEGVQPENLIGLDLSEEMLKIAEDKYPKVRFISGDAENLPFEDDSFDVVIASFLIVHLADLEKAFQEAYRVLKAGGIFIVTNINQRKAPKLLAGKQEFVINSHYHRPEKVLNALEDSFFKIEREKFVEEDGVWINQIIKAVK